MKKAKKRPKLNNLYLILGSAIIILSLLAVFNFQTNSGFTCQDQYKMELYVLRPDNTEIKIKECNSNNPDFQCTSTYTCTQGTYGRAITYLTGRIVSDTNWEKMC